MTHSWCFCHEIRMKQLSLIGTYNINFYIKKNVSMPNFLWDVVNVFQHMTEIDKLFENSDNLNDNDLRYFTSLIFEKRYKKKMLRMKNHQLVDFFIFSTWLTTYYFYWYWQVLTKQLVRTFSLYFVTWSDFKTSKDFCN